MSELPDTADSIQAWLVGIVAMYLETPTDEIDPAKSFVQQGVDSLSRMEIREEIEMQLGVKLEPKLVTGESEICDVARLIEERLAGSASGPSMQP